MLKMLSTLTVFMYLFTTQFLELFKVKYIHLKSKPAHFYFYFNRPGVARAFLQTLFLIS